MIKLKENTMSLKLKALLIMAGVLSITVGGIFLLEYIATYVTYGLILARLEYEQKLDEISKNIKEITKG